MAAKTRPREHPPNPRRLITSAVRNQKASPRLVQSNKALDYPGRRVGWIEVRLARRTLMSRASTGALVIVVVLATLISAALIASYITGAPAIPRCSTCTQPGSPETCSCPDTEDIGLWGALYKARWDYLLASLSLIAAAAYSTAGAVGKALDFRIARKQSRTFQAQINKLIFEQRFAEAASLTRCYKDSPLAVAVSSALQRNLPEELATRGLFT